MYSRSGTLILALIFLLCGCQWLPSREKRTQKLVDQELASINWNEVDQFPLFEACDESVSKEEQRQCFERTLLMHFSMTLQDFEFQTEQSLKDTLFIDFLIDNQGTITILEIEENAAIRNENPEFEGIVSRSLKSLPRIQPALKRGIPVATQFRIPLVIRTDE